MPRQLDLGLAVLQQQGKGGAAGGDHVVIHGRGGLAKMHAPGIGFAQPSQPLIVEMNAIFLVEQPDAVPQRPAHHPAGRRRKFIDLDDFALWRNLQMGRGTEIEIVLQHGHSAEQKARIPLVIVFQDGNVIARDRAGRGIEGGGLRLALAFNKPNAAQPLGRHGASINAHQDFQAQRVAGLVPNGLDGLLQKEPARGIACQAGGNEDGECRHLD